MLAQENVHWVPWDGVDGGTGKVGGREGAFLDGEEGTGGGSGPGGKRIGEAYPPFWPDWCCTGLLGFI